MAANTQRALDMLNTAREMEEKGRAFYAEAVKKTENQLGRDIFRMLMADEVMHVERINSIFNALSGGRWSSEWKQKQPDHGDLGSLFADMARRHGKNIHADTKDLEALEIGIGFEAKAVAFYEEQLKLAADQLEKEFLQAMVEEEKTHHQLLVEMKYYLESPDSWFQEKGRGGLDGA